MAVKVYISFHSAGKLKIGYVVHSNFAKEITELRIISIESEMAYTKRLSN